MIHVRDGLSLSNENSTLGDALFRLLAERRRRKRRNAEKAKVRTRNRNDHKLNDAD